MYLGQSSLGNIPSTFGSTMGFSHVVNSPAIPRLPRLGRPATGLASDGLQPYSGHISQSATGSSRGPKGLFIQRPNPMELDKSYEEVP